jgi:hypothetical protein
MTHEVGHQAVLLVADGRTMNICALQLYEIFAGCMKILDAWIADNGEFTT